MKLSEFYQKVLNLENQDNIFNYLISTLKPSILLWNYFVNWEKVTINTKRIEISLNILNYLIGKNDFDKEFKFLIKNNPSVITAIPSLIVRDGGNNQFYKILVDFKNKKFVYEDYDFTIKNPTDSDIEKYLTFIRESGLKDLLVSQRIKNLVDYMIGVEAGLDSNGRKNRSGKSMENIVDFFINDLCVKKGYEYLKEANAQKIKEKWGLVVPVDKSSRRYDFVINKEDDLYIIETNFYGGGGSKLKSTAGEYRNLYDVLKGKYNFIWITDGIGWKGTTRPLRETFDHNDYVINLSMLENEILNSII